MPLKVSLGEFGKVFCSEIVSRALKKELLGHLDSKPGSPAIGQRCLRTFRGYFHSV